MEPAVDYAFHVRTGAHVAVAPAKLAGPSALACHPPEERRGAVVCCGLAGARVAAL
jgi:hypothetical protein